MIKTFNRAPYSTPTPSSSDVKNYFFNHYNWKGVNTNKNVLAVDQETFEDCNNVYIDADGLLRSRPAIKQQALTIKHLGADGNEYFADTSNIKNVWAFENVTAYWIDDIVYFVDTTKSEYASKLYVGAQDTIRVELFYNYIIVFIDNAYGLYNLTTGEVIPTFSAISISAYVPVTKFYLNNYEQTAPDTKNVIFDSYRTKYSYDSIDRINSSAHLNKYVRLYLDDTSYSFQMTKNKEQVFVQKYVQLDDSPMIATCDTDVIVTYSCTKLSDSTYTFNMTCHIGANIHKKLPEIVGSIVNKPFLSKDGKYLFVIKQDDIYCISLSATEENTYTYETWTPIFVSTHSGKLSEYVVLNHISMSVDETNFQMLSDLKHSSMFNACFVDDTIYTLVVPTSTSLNLWISENGVLRLKAKLMESYDTNEPLRVRQWADYTPALDCSYDKKVLTIGVIAASVSNKDTVNEKFTLHYYSFIGDTTTVTDQNWHNLVPSDLSAIPLKCRDASVLHVVDTLEYVNYLWRLTSTVYKKTAADSGPISLYTYTHSMNSSERTYPVRIFSADGNYFLTEKYLYQLYSTERINYLFSAAPICYGSYLYVYNSMDNYIYTSNLTQLITIEVETRYTLLTIPTITSAVNVDDKLYIASGNKLYISEPKHKNDEHQLYFPEKNTQTFSKQITALHTLSSTDVAIFFTDEIVRVTYDASVSAYRYYALTLPVGCNANSDVLTTFDGVYTIFPSSRGLVAANYQQFINTNEQQASYLSDNIHSLFSKYIDERSTTSIKLFKHNYWIIVYRQDCNNGFIFDTRNSSWWPFTALSNLTKLIAVDNTPYLLSDGKMYTFDASDISYYDDDTTRHKISWHIKSQKLHLSALNNYKHIVNITFVSVHDIDILNASVYNIDESNFKLRINNYRKQRTGTIDTDNYTAVDYDIETVKTYVQRLNYSKVNEFQYLLSSNDENAIALPLSLNGITIKYKVGGQVR